MTMQEKALEAKKLFTPTQWDNTKDEDQSICFKNDKEWEYKPYKQELQDIIFKLQEDTDMNTAYEAVYNAIEFLTYTESDDDDEIIEEFGREAEFIYHNDATNWLSKSLNNYHAVEEVLKSNYQLESLTLIISIARERVYERAMQEVLNVFNNA